MARACSMSTSIQTLFVSQIAVVAYTISTVISQLWMMGFCRRDAQEQWNREHSISGQAVEEAPQQHEPKADLRFASFGSDGRARGGE